MPPGSSAQWTAHEARCAMSEILRHRGPRCWQCNYNGGDVRRSCGTDIRRVRGADGGEFPCPNQWRLSRLRAGGKALSNRRARYNPSGRFQFLLDIE